MKILDWITIVQRLRVGDYQLPVLIKTNWDHVKISDFQIGGWVDVNTERSTEQGGLAGPKKKAG